MSKDEAPLNARQHLQHAERKLARAHRLWRFGHDYEEPTMLGILASAHVALANALIAHDGDSSLAGD